MPRSGMKSLSAGGLHSAVLRKNGTALPDKYNMAYLDACCRLEFWLRIRNVSTSESVGYTRTPCITMTLQVKHISCLESCLGSAQVFILPLCPSLPKALFRRSTFALKCKLIIMIQQR